MRPILSAAVMHVPSDEWRAENVQRLKRDIPGLYVMPDFGRGNLWRTAALAWMSYDAAATHHLVIQDDAVPCRNFWAGLHHAVEAQPSGLLNLFSMRAQIETRARKAGSHWCRIDLVLGVAVVMPTPVIRRFVAWCHRNVRYEYPHDDVRLRAWCQHTRYPVYATVPCLVQHGRPAHSLAGQSEPSRRSRYVAEDALSIDWTRGAASPPYQGGGHVIQRQWDELRIGAA